MKKREPNREKLSSQRRACFDDLTHMAESELAAFTGAVYELFGHEEARVSADEWIEELLSADRPIGAGIADWRHITIMASIRLASRVCRNAESTSPMKARRHGRTPHKFPNHEATVHK